MEKLQNFLISCSGASKSILSECPDSERIKYAGIGATILLTATLAFFSGGYALYTVFDSVFAAIPFGIIWALMIFNLDRLIVASMRKRGNWRKQFTTALPRLLLAVFIAIVISKPLEIKLLETKINKVLFETKQEKVDGLSAGCKEISDDYDNRIKKKQGEIAEKEAQKPPIMASLEQQLEQKQAEYEEKEKDIRKTNQPYYNRIVRLENELKTIGLGSAAYEDLQSQIRDANRRIARNKEKLQPLENDIQSIEAEINKEFETYKNDLDALRSKNNNDIQTLVAAKTQSLQECQSNKKEGEIIYGRNSLPDLLVALRKATDDNSIMSWISLFIMGLFIMLETAPVFVKLIAPKGPYDEKLEEIEHQHQIEALAEINKRNHNLNHEIHKLTILDEAEINQELENSKQVLRTISEGHHELIKEQIKIWVENEKMKLRNGHLDNDNLNLQ